MYDAIIAKTKSCKLPCRSINLANRETYETYNFLKILPYLTFLEVATQFVERMGNLFSGILYKWPNCSLRVLSSVPLPTVPLTYLSSSLFLSRLLFYPPGCHLAYPPVCVSIVRLPTHLTAIITPWLSTYLFAAYLSVCFVFQLHVYLNIHLPAIFPSRLILPACSPTIEHKPFYLSHTFVS